MNAHSYHRRPDRGTGGKPTLPQLFHSDKTRGCSNMLHAARLNNCPGIFGIEESGGGGVVLQGAERGSHFVYFMWKETRLDGVASQKTPLFSQQGIPPFHTSKTKSICLCCPETMQ